MVDMYPNVKRGRITAIEWCLPNPQDLAKTLIPITDTSHQNRGATKRNTVTDDALGTVTRRIKCRTCKGTASECGGHPAYIALTLPVMNIEHQPKILELVKSVCYHCSRIKLANTINDPHVARILLLPKEQRGKTLLKLITGSTNNKAKKPTTTIGTTAKAQNNKKPDYFNICGSQPNIKFNLETYRTIGCGSIQPQYYIEGGTYIRIRWPKGTKIRKEDLYLTPTKIHSILRGIHHDDLPLFGLTNNPEWMMIENLVVAPGSIQIDEEYGERQQKSHMSDISIKYSKIIKYNKRLKDNLENGGSLYSDVKLAARTATTAHPTLDEIKIGKEEEEQDEDNDDDDDKDEEDHHVQKQVAEEEEIQVDDDANDERRAQDNDLHNVARKKQFKKRAKVSLSPTHYERKRKRTLSTRELYELVQFHVSTLICNEKKDVTQSVHKGGQATGCFHSRLQKKDGVMRHGGLHKRVNYSARAVIIGDPFLETDEVGIPEGMAKILTYPVPVTTFNPAECYGWVRNGNNIWPGAKLIERKNGLDHIDLSITNVDRELIELYEGDIIHRHILDNRQDIGIVNRQPSLHAPSIMSQYIRVFKGDNATNVIRLNEEVTKGYNADFDGDEMNLHIPQSAEVRAELIHLKMGVYQNIRAEKDGKPIISFIQDCISGASSLSQPDVLVTWTELQHIIMISKCSRFFKQGDLPKPALCKAGQWYWTGLQVFELFFPSTLYVTNKMSDYFPKKQSLPSLTTKELKAFLRTSSRPGTFVKHSSSFQHIVNIIQQYYQEPLTPTTTTGKITPLPYLPNGNSPFLIERGQIILGRIGNQELKMILSNIFTDYGAERAGQFLNELKRVLLYWSTKTCVSVGMEDYISLQNKPENKIACDYIAQLRKYTLDWIDNYVEKTKDPLYIQQNNICILLQELSKRTGQIALTLNESEGFHLNGHKNQLLQIIEAGGKGSYVHTSQIMDSLAQQTLTHVPRLEATLPHYHKFPKHLDTAVKHGYIQSSFGKGLENYEMYQHAIAGRVGQVLVSVKTSETGYEQRKIEKCLEDTKCEYDQSIRFGQGLYLQDYFGGDGTDSSKIENCQLRILLLSDFEFQQIYYITPLKLFAQQHQSSMEQQFLKLTEFRNEIRMIQLRTAGKVDPCIRSFLPMDRILHHASYIITNPDVDNTVAVVDFGSLLETFLLHFDNEFPSIIKNNLYLHALLYDWLSFASLQQYHITTLEQFHFITQRIIYYYVNSRMTVGTSPGPAAAASIGEPATQMTLNVFQLAGVASNRSIGVPRLQEVLHATSGYKLKHAMMTLHLNKDFILHKYAYLNSNYESLCHGFAYKLMECHMKDLIDSFTIHVHPADIDVADTHLPIHLQSYCQIQLNTEKCILHHLTLDYIISKIHYHLSKACGPLDIQKSDETNKMYLNIHLNTLTRYKFNEKHLKGLVGAWNESAIQQFYMIFKSKLKFVHVSGILGIKLARVIPLPKDMMQYINLQTGNIEDCLNKDEFLIETQGANVSEVFACPEVDLRFSTSNDLEGIATTLGIVAARQAVENELFNVLLASNNTFVDKRQLKLTAAVGTFWGLLLPFTLAGLLAKEKGTLKKAAFESSVQHIQQACLYNNKDVVHGIVDHIILGSEVQVGTGMVRLIHPPPSTFNDYPPPLESENSIAPVTKWDIPYHPKPASFYQQFQPKHPTEFHPCMSSATLIEDISMKDDDEDCLEDLPAIKSILKRKGNEATQNQNSSKEEEEKAREKQKQKEEEQEVNKFKPAYQFSVFKYSSSSWTIIHPTQPTFF